jgi:hypothetical protein
MTDKKLQLVVEYLNNQTRYYPVTLKRGWRLDTIHRQIIVGLGVPRTMIPLDSVAAYHIEQVEDDLTWIQY